MRGDPSYTHPLLTRADLAPAREKFALSCAASRKWNQIVAAALTLHGDHGPAISGIGRDHFPETLKTELRLLARSISAAVDAAHSNRPKHVRSQTIIRLGQAVARQQGSGFYGVHP